tara:strand:+ start:312 stop:761 length:450 start_codon:yes stop_codon:yes gene_type:complete
MSKINKSDLENIKILKKELKDSNLNSIKIKKGQYELEIALKESKKQLITEIDDKEKKLKKNSENFQKKSESKENIVSSPMVGVVYLSADPSSPSYVKVGQHVKQGDVLLLIEAMKTFNEIKAPKTGVIKEIRALNSQPVEFGDTLIIFE